ncbi:uncharacterized protein RAG0_08986 [Rhynchosporium agropyri]|uniref:Uncharacterized protein n=2 Tax=Rhynchosporium TaxID=38037 RepID=A0A1E1MLW7_RHYSE|nr:uncharacterized protein RAG0_08986 [Rhynchosporium agropyri]CZT50072.1 uncharacterized protein RSE6_10996 [Rhynchosporium secalis]
MSATELSERLREEGNVLHKAGKLDQGTVSLEYTYAAAS